MPSHAFTIAKLANAAGVNIETVRYYQRRGLLDEPSRENGGFRSYSEDHVQRLRFIKRSQELGFSLDDAAELLSLSKATHRKRLRDITHARVLDIRQRISQLEAMASALEGLADCCAKTAQQQACPIIAALAGNAFAVTEQGYSRPQEAVATAG
jgi:MerR family mercuric resistance operon transcriptional regulator